MTQANVDVAGTGFTVLDKIYRSNESAVQALGGSCGNVLVSLAMLDRVVCPVLALGEDSVGEHLVSEFTQAGADTRYIFRRSDIASPVLAQQLDVATSQHIFSFVCPETVEELAPYQPIDEDDVRKAQDVLHACSVFYVDRLSDAILEAMETAADAGAVIYFEPSSVGDWPQFERALSLASVLKFSTDRLQETIVSAKLRPGAILIVTKGAEGLEVRQEGRVVQRAAIPAQVVRDTCGSGDMVSVGVIDWILSRVAPATEPLELDEILDGVVAGQRLAAANCAYVGARGLFRQHGADLVRRVLDDVAVDIEPQLENF